MTTDPEAIRRKVATARRELRDALHARRMSLPPPYTAEQIPPAAIKRIRAAEGAVDAAEADARRRGVRC